MGDVLKKVEPSNSQESSIDEYTIDENINIITEETD